MGDRVSRRNRIKAGSGRWSDGTAVVELALVLPILTILMMGMWDFGRVLHDSARLASAARAGVQYGSQDDVTAADTAGMEQAARDDAGDLEAALTVTATQFCQCPDTSPVACGESCGGPGQTRMYVGVLVEESFELWFPYPFVTSPLEMGKQAIMRVE